LAATLLLSACTGEAESPETSAPATTTTSAPAPTTTTSAAPTPKAEPTKIVVPLDTVRDLDVVCEGDGHPDAAAYDPASPGPRPVVVFDLRRADYWSQSVQTPYDWFEREEPELVPVVA